MSNTKSKLLFENGILQTWNHYIVDLKLMCCISNIPKKEENDLLFQLTASTT